MGENGGTARGDAVLGQEGVEVVEGVVDALSGLEALEIVAEVGEMIGGFLFQLFGVMLWTENRTWIGDRESASATTCRAIGATNGKSDGISSLWFHFGPRSGVGMAPAVVFFDAECGND